MTCLEKNSTLANDSRKHLYKKNQKTNNKIIEPDSLKGPQTYHLHPSLPLRFIANKITKQNKTTVFDETVSH